MICNSTLTRRSPLPRSTWHPGPRKHIAKRSRRQAAEDRAWSKIKPELFAECGGLCQLKLPGCTGKAVDLHHRFPKGRGGLSVKANGVPGCRHCHDWIKAHPKKADELGLTLRSWEAPKEIGGHIP
jgi:hypothetical protein